MNKQEFLNRLGEGLSGLPEADIEERLIFYSEMIDDRMEEGLEEDAAVSAIGTVDEIVSQIIADTPLSKIAKEKLRSKRRLKVWEILLLVLGAPLWIPLSAAAFAVIFALYLSVWSIILALWAVFASLVGCSVGGVIAGIVFLCSNNVLSGIAMLGAGIACAGLAILWFLGCKLATKGILLLTKKLVLWMKNCFMKKEETK